MALSSQALAILQQMDPNRGYEPRELRAFAPHLTLEGLQEVMRELWVARQVERIGYSGWRRERSATSHAPARSTADHRSTASRPRQVKPEDLFDHNAFEGLFK